MKLAQEIQQYLEEMFPKGEVHIYDPRGDRAMGRIVDESFSGEYEDERLKRVWDALKGRFDGESKRIGMLLLFTPDEYADLREFADANV